MHIFMEFLVFLYKKKVMDGQGTLLLFISLIFEINKYLSITSQFANDPAIALYGWAGTSANVNKLQASYLYDDYGRHCVFEVSSVLVV